MCTGNISLDPPAPNRVSDLFALPHLPSSRVGYFSPRGKVLRPSSRPAGSSFPPPVGRRPPGSPGRRNSPKLHAAPKTSWMRCSTAAAARPARCKPWPRSRCCCAAWRVPRTRQLSRCLRPRCLRRCASGSPMPSWPSTGSALPCCRYSGGSWHSRWVDKSAFTLHPTTEAWRFLKGRPL